MYLKKRSKHDRSHNRRRAPYWQAWKPDSTGTIVLEESNKNWDLLKEVDMVALFVVGLIAFFGVDGCRGEVCVQQEACTTGPATGRTQAHGHRVVPEPPVVARLALGRSDGGRRRTTGPAG